jgi:hypothetical protein
VLFAQAGFFISKEEIYGTQHLFSTDTTELAKAMLKVQSTLQPAFKDRENTFSNGAISNMEEQSFPPGDVKQDEAQAGRKEDGAEQVNS